MKLTQMDKSAARHCVTAIEAKSSRKLLSFILESLDIEEADARRLGVEASHLSVYAKFATDFISDVMQDEKCCCPVLVDPEAAGPEISVIRDALRILQLEGVCVYCRRLKLLTLHKEITAKHEQLQKADDEAGNAAMNRLIELNTRLSPA